MTAGAQVFNYCTALPPHPCFSELRPPFLTHFLSQHRTYAPCLLLIPVDYGQVEYQWKSKSQFIRDGSQGLGKGGKESEVPWIWASPGETRSSCFPFQFPSLSGTYTSISVFLQVKFHRPSGTGFHLRGHNRVTISGKEPQSAEHVF